MRATAILLILACAHVALAGTPTPTIASTSGSTHDGTSDSLTGTVTMSEAVYTTGAADVAFESDDLTLSGCTLDSGGFVETTAGTVWEFTLTPSGTGDCTVDIAANEAHSTADDSNNAIATTLTYTFAPTAVIACSGTNYGANAHDNGDASCTVTLSHSSSNFAVGDLTIGANQGVIENFAGSGTDYTFDINVDDDGNAGANDGEDGDISVSISASTWTDSGTSSDNAATSAYVLTYGPSVSLSPATTGHDAVNAVVVTATISGNGAVDSELVDGDWTVSGCTAGTTTKVSATSYTVEVTPSGTGSCSVSLAAGKFTEVTTLEANLATKETTVIYFDTPSVVVAATDGNQGTQDGATAVPMSVTFATPVGTTGSGTNDFVEGDITISGGSTSNFAAATGSTAGRVWTFDATPSGTDNMVVYVAASKATSTTSGNWNTASDIEIFVYTVQSGLVSVSSITSDSALGAAISGTVSASGSTTTVTLANMFWVSQPADASETGVKLCLDRSADSSISAAAVDGVMWVELTFPAVADAEWHVIVDSDGDDDFSDETVTDGGTNTALAATLKWADGATGDECLYVGLDGTAGWAADAVLSCAAAAEDEDIAIEATNVGTDASCTDGGTTTNCGTNARYFTGAMDTITIARSVDVPPTVTVLSKATVDALFDAADLPPDTNDAAYAQDEPEFLVVLSRTCTTDLGSIGAANTAALSTSNDVTIDFTNALEDVSGSTGIVSGSNYDFYDVTAAYTDTDETWTTLRSGVDYANDQVTSISFDGQDCGATKYKYILVKFHRGDGSATISATEQALFDFSETSAITPSCATSYYANADPITTFTIWNDATRDTIDFDASVSTDPIDARFFMSDLSIGSTSITANIGPRLHVAGDGAKKGLHIVSLGTGLPDPDTTGLATSATGGSLTDFCSNLPTTWLSQMVSGAATDNALFDALFANSGVYQTSVTDTEFYGFDADADGTDDGSTAALDYDISLASYPYYPTPNGDNGVFSAAWQATAASTTATDFCYVGSTTNSEFCAKYALDATLTELRACKNYDGSDVLTVSTDEDAGTSTYTITLTHQIISYGGTNADDRDWTLFKTNSKTITFSFDTDVVSSVSLQATGVGTTAVASLHSFSFESCDSSECADTSDDATMGVTDGGAYDCDCGGTCGSDAAFRRVLYYVDVLLDKASSQVAGEAGILDTIHAGAALARATQDSDKKTCYGLETSSALSGVEYIPTHADSATKNLFRITARSKCINQYESSVTNALSDLAFQSCSNAADKNDYSMRVKVFQHDTIGTTWETGLANRDPVGSFTQVGTLDLDIQFHAQATPSTGVITPGSAYSASTTTIYTSPDTEVAGTWQQVASQGALAAFGPSTTLRSVPMGSRVVLTHALSHAFLKDEAVLHIRDVHVCTLNSASQYYNCLHPDSTDPENDGTDYGADGGVTQVACPTGANADLAYSCDAARWQEFIPSPSGDDVSPVSSSYAFVRNFKPTITWGGDGDSSPSCTLCRYESKSAAQQETPAATASMCANYANSDYYCGTSATTWNSLEPASSRSGIDNLWGNLEGFGNVDTTPVRAGDAVELNLNGLPTSVALVITLRSRITDCGDGSANDGARRLLRGVDGAHAYASFGGRRLSGGNTTGDGNTGSSSSIYIAPTVIGDPVAEEASNTGMILLIVAGSLAGLVIIVLAAKAGNGCNLGALGGSHAGDDDDEAAPLKGGGMTLGRHAPPRKPRRKARA